MTNKRFIEQFEENVQRYPDKVILRDEHNSLTFRELDELSGRVYAYLKEKGIGREDFVMISLPQGILPYVAMIGVWKTGAAFVPCGEGVPQERESYIYEECRCKGVINLDNWGIVTNHVAIEGHSDTSVHDAAYAVYTSGSEGKPKGGITEYGYLEFLAQTARNEDVVKMGPESNYFMLMPMFTVGAILSLIQGIWTGFVMDVGSRKLVRNVSALKDYFIERKIDITCMSPSFLRFTELRTPYLKQIILTSERTSDLFMEGCSLVNTYVQTEGYFISWFKIDKSYNNTPIGKPTYEEFGVELVEDGKIVKEGEIGELCYKNNFFRGYINNAEATETILSGGWQHSGDIAQRLPDGNYVILGRKSDMIKINGNRIEPAEIEAAVKRVLGIDWAFAKGFVMPERSFIVVYYTADIQIDYARTREQLLDILPTYMIPSYFVHLDEVPHLPNGKVDRQALRAPEIEQYRAEYVAPENDIEEQLCAQMGRILGTSIGALDDFYLMGGDSLRTIQLVTNLQIDGLTVTDIYAARTPRAIAARLQSRASGASSSSSAATSSAPAPHQAPKAPHQPKFLLPYSQMVYELEQQMPGVYTFPFTLEYDPEHIDTQRLNIAIATAIAAHPVFEGNEQYYSIEARGEKARGYLKMRLNRILGDGYSFGILLEDICRAYHGLPIPEDHYIDYLAEYKNHTQSPEYAEHRDALVAHYADCGSDTCPVRPTLDKEIEEGDEWLAGEYILPLPNSVSEGGKGATQWRDRGYSMNERVCLATSMAIMDYCGTDAAALTWAYLGRENEQQMHIFGSLHKDIPLVVKRAKCTPGGLAQSELVQELKEEMRQGIIMSDYPYTLTQPYHDTWAYAVNVLQQPRMEDINLHGLEFSLTPSSANSASSSEATSSAPAHHQSYSLLDIEIEDNQLRIKYSATHYRESSIARFAELIQKALTLL